MLDESRWRPREAERIRQNSEDSEAELIEQSSRNSDLNPQLITDDSVVTNTNYGTLEDVLFHRIMR